ncbi:MAG: hypothetical protein JNK76_07065 [Planctomycetales bacterium]|nr:hypothetical protein [Planctomycetales bacterium]
MRADGLRAMSRISRKRIDEVGTVNKAAQIQLGLKYRELLYEKRPLPDLEDVEFRAYSQNGEDGLLLFLFTLIGTTNKRCVEICAGNGVECNTANLIINHGWDGLLFDGNGANVRAGRKFYATCPDTFALPPKFVKAWITTESVNQLIREHGFAGEVDLLSLDLDGNDYWIWEALDCVDPRAVILEYQNAWGPEQCVTQRYNPRFVWNGELEAHVGASLPAFVKLARRKGYRLVGCQRYEFNAIFLRNGVGEELFPEIPVEACFRRPLPRPKTATGVELVQV